jgi:hypothetical protein
MKNAERRNAHPFFVIRISSFIIDSGIRGFGFRHSPLQKARFCDRSQNRAFKNPSELHRRNKNRLGHLQHR